jgi:hypothetical protein
MNNITDSISPATSNQYSVMWVMAGVLVFAVAAEYIYHKYYDNSIRIPSAQINNNDFWQVTAIIFAVLIISVGIQYISHARNNNPI